jgi:hypothetical protein
MDNCGGQNKNRYVLHLATLFVELDYYLQVNIIFLVAGHTKNAADRLFNLLKQVYRKQQVYSMEQMVSILDSNEYVSCTKVGVDDFCNYGEFEDSVYKHSPLTGNTKNTNFSTRVAKRRVYCMQKSNTSEEAHRMDLRKGTEERREEILKYFDMDDVPPLIEKDPGIKHIKQVELYTKWRKHVPDEFKSPLYDHPGDDVLQSVKDDWKSKKEYVISRRLNQQTVDEVVDAAGILAARKLPTKKQSSTKKKAPKKKTSRVKPAPKEQKKRGRASKTSTTASKKKK